MATKNHTYRSSQLPLKPCSQEEAKRLHELLRCGDQSARAQLAEGFTALAYNRTWRFLRCHSLVTAAWFDDLLGSALLTLVAAVNHLPIRRVNPFAYIAKSLERAIQSHWERDQRHPTQSLVVDRDDEQSPFLCEPVDPHVSETAAIELWDAVAKVCWFGHSAQIVRMWSESFTFEEIAEQIGLPVSTTHHQFKKGLAALKDHFGVSDEKTSILQNLAASALKKTCRPASTNREAPVATNAA
jgi:RNA polymerase sigma factor (sigma-70 family)